MGIQESGKSLITMSEKKRCGLLVFLCAFIALVAGSKPEIDEQQEALLGDKVQKLTQWSARKSVIRLTPDRYKDYLKSAPRNYSVVVMLTALKKERGCMLCIQANEQYQLLADSWRQTAQFSNSLFFTVLDYDESPDVFHSLKVNGVPIFMHFPSKGKRTRADTMELTSMDVPAEEIARWVEDRTHLQIKVIRPIDYVKIVSVTTALVVVVGVLSFLRKRLHWIVNSTSGAITVLTVIFPMISGYMWNQIRKPPNMHMDHRTGQPIYIHPNRGSQFVMETYIIMMLRILRPVLLYRTVCVIH